MAVHALAVRPLTSGGHVAALALCCVNVDQLAMHSFREGASSLCSPYKSHCLFSGAVYI